MPRAESSDADTDEKAGVVTVQTTLLHHVIRDVARGPTTVEFIAHLVRGDDRGLRGCEGDALGRSAFKKLLSTASACAVGAVMATTLSSTTDKTRPAKSDRTELGEHSWVVDIRNLSAEQKRERC
jgi:hypothetical protein